MDGIDQAGLEEGFAYGAFAGAEMPISSSLFAGVEASIGRSEADTEATVFRGVELVEAILIGVIEQTKASPRWNYAFTGRVGFDLSRSVSLYGLAGIGGERVRIETRTDLNEFGASALRIRRSYEGVTFGGGARLFLSDRIGARLEYRRTETDDGYDPERVTAGLLYRF